MDQEELAAASAPSSALNSVDYSIRALYDSNTEFRRLIEEAFRIVEERLRRPKGLLLLRAARSQGQFNRLGASLARVAWYRQAREEEKTEPARRWAFKICDDEILSRACRGLFGGEPVVSGDGTLRISSSLETPMSPEGRAINTQQFWDWLVKRFALQHGLKRSWELAFACALLGRDEMPPFQADPDSRQKNRNRKKREKVRQRYQELDHPLKERLSRIEAALEAGDSAPPSVWRVLVAENIGSYLDSLSKKRHEAFAEYVECYAKLANTSDERFEQACQELITGASQRGRATGLATAMELAPTEQETTTYRERWKATTLGADWWLDEGTQDLESFRQKLLEKQTETELRLYACGKVHESLQRRGDPWAALLKPVTETARRLTESQSQKLTALRQLLLEGESLRTSKREQWRRRFEELSDAGQLPTGEANSPNFESYWRGVERGAHNCFGTEKKSNWPEKYQGYASGGFARLIEDLWDGSWTESVDR